MKYIDMLNTMIGNEYEATKQHEVINDLESFGFVVDEWNEGTRRTESYLHISRGSKKFTACTKDIVGTGKFKIVSVCNGFKSF